MTKQQEVYAGAAPRYLQFFTGGEHEEQLERREFASTARLSAHFMQPARSTIDPYTDPFINDFLRTEMKKLRQQQQTIIFKGDISATSKRLLNRPSIDSGLDKTSSK